MTLSMHLPSLRMISTLHLHFLGPYMLTAYKDSNRDFSPNYKPIPGPDSLLEGDNLHIYKTTSNGIQNHPQFAFYDAWDNLMHQVPSTPIIFSAFNQEGRLDESNPVFTSVSFVNGSVDGQVAIGPRIEYLAATRTSYLHCLSECTLGTSGSTK